MIKTSYFSKYKEPNGISIALSTPNWFTGEKYLNLNPNYDMLNEYKHTNNEVKYYHQYLDILEKLDPIKVLDDLDGKVLLCYEKSGTFCHRKLFSNWIQEKTGIIIPEHDYDILSFRNEYNFLSNFYPVSFIINNQIWESTENIYQAWKTLDLKDREQIRCVQPSVAKKLGKTVKMCDNWDEYKVQLMKKLLDLKFNKKEHPGLCKLLLETENRKIVEGNYWCDNFFGVCYCRKCNGLHGKNILGKMLMKKRTELRNENN